MGRGPGAQHHPGHGAADRAGEGAGGDGRGEGAKGGGGGHQGPPSLSRRGTSGPCPARAAGRPSARGGGRSEGGRRPAAALLRGLLDRNLGVILLLPSALTFLVLLVFPLGYGIWTSFFQRHVLDPEGSLGRARELRLAVRQCRVLALARHLGLWAGATVGLQILLGTAVALILHQPFKGRSLVRGLVLFPYMMPVVSVILVWMLLYNALYGVHELAAGAGPGSWSRRSPGCPSRAARSGAWSSSASGSTSPSSSSSCWRGCR